MKIRLHLIHEADPRLWQRLDWMYMQLERLHAQNAVILSNQESLMATIQELVASVREVKGKADSIGMLITQLREQVLGLTQGNLPPDVQAQVDQAFADAEAAKKELSDAVDNTGGKPATPIPPEQDAPPPANIGNDSPAPPFSPAPMAATGQVTKTDNAHS